MLIDVQNSFAIHETQQQLLARHGGWMSQVVTCVNMHAIMTVWVL